MFIELHKPDSSAITINLDKLEYFIPADNGKHAMVSVPNCNGSIVVEESYEQVKELIEKCLKK